MNPAWEYSPRKETVTVQIQPVIQLLLGTLCTSAPFKELNVDGQKPIIHPLKR